MGDFDFVGEGGGSHFNLWKKSSPFVDSALNLGVWSRKTSQD